MVGPGLTFLLGLLFSAYQLELVDAGALGPGSNADWEFCSSSNQCGIGGGDCDKNSDCENGLICGQDNCKTWHPQAHQAADCCMEDPNAPKCSAGWTKYKDACYFESNEKKTWNDASLACQQMQPGAHLTSVLSRKENNFLNTFYNGTKDSYWVGGERKQGTNDWRWSNGDVWTWPTAPKNGQYPWNSVEPNNAKGNENSISAYPGGKGWNDTPKNYQKLPFICKYYSN